MKLKLVISGYDSIHGDFFRWKLMDGRKIVAKRDPFMTEPDARRSAKLFARHRGWELWEKKKPVPKECDWELWKKSKACKHRLQKLIKHKSMNVPKILWCRECGAIKEPWEDEWRLPMSQMKGTR